jgi:hypothetical protein
MSRLLTSPTRHNPHIHSTHVPDWVTTDLVEVDKPLTAGFLGFTQITANSSIHTKATSYTDIIATTSANATLMRVLLKNTFTSNTATSNLVDIALGASSSEVDIVQNLNAGALADYTGSTTSGAAEYWIPVFIPAGSRISARNQALISSDTVDVHVTLYAGSNRTATAIDTLGATTATSLGTTVICGINAVEGAWTQIVASTSAAYSGLLWGVGAAADISVIGGPILMDIGTGANPSEVAILSNLVITTGATEFVIAPRAQPIHRVYIPAGTRISARLQFQTNNAQSLDVILYGLR